MGNYQKSVARLDQSLISPKVLDAVAPNAMLTGKLGAQRLIYPSAAFC